MPHPPMMPTRIGLSPQEAVYANAAAKFQTFSFDDEGHELAYNLFVPENTAWPLPLVVFMHDMGSISEETDYTLRQGIGALVWTDEKE